MIAALLMLLCLPADLLGILVVAVVTSGSGARCEISRGALLVRIRPGSLLARRWQYSTALGHVVLLHPSAGGDVLEHELVHVAQFEAACCATWLVLLAALLLPWWCVPLLSWALVYAGASLAAWLTGGDAYVDNTFERHARAESGS